jgi:hypothetical protein
LDQSSPGDPQPGSQLDQDSGRPRGALGTVDGELLVVLKTRLPRSDGNDVAPALAGTTLSRNQDRFIVQCGDGPLEILAWSAATS